MIDHKGGITMFRVQLRPVSQQQNSTIYRPMASAANQITGTQTSWQTGGVQAQGFIPTNYQQVSNFQVPTNFTTSLVQSYQVPSTTLSTTLPQTTMVPPWQSYQPVVYAQSFHPMSTGFAQQSFMPTTTGLAPMAQTSSMIYPQQQVVQGISHNIVQPKVDISETNSEVVLSYDLPLVDQNNLNLSVSHDSVTLQANSGQGIFYRTVNLPTDVFPESAEASLTNEILEIRIPKASQSRRKVNINQQDVQAQHQG